MKIVPFFLALGLFVQTTAFATPLPTQPLLEVVDFDYQGEQCQQLNLEAGPFIVENGDEQSLEIPFGTSFDAFTDEQNYSVHNQCKVVVTLQVPEGYQVAPDYVTYLGTANISPEGKGTVMASYRLGGESLLAAAEIFDGGFSGGFAVESSYATDAQWSECGGEVELIADANIDLLRSQAVAEDGNSEILGEGLLCGYSLRPCDSDLARKPKRDQYGCTVRQLQSKAPGVTACVAQIEQDILNGVKNVHYLQCTGRKIECCQGDKDVTICEDANLTVPPGGKPSQPGPIDPIGPIKPSIP